MRICAITLSPQGALVLERIRKMIPAVDCYVHENVATPPWVKKFSRVVELTRQLFGKYEGLVYVAPCGAVIRAIAPLATDKKTDPAVVVVDVGGRHAISLLSGHEGGANELALQVANAIGAEPVITTTTEAVKNLIVGVGMRRGRPAADIVAAVTQAMAEVKSTVADARFLASADIKHDEAGLIEAARIMDIPLRFIDGEEIRNSTRHFDHSDFVWKKVNLPAVAEPCALLAGRRTKLILKRKICNGVTVAVARENCLSLE
ncbi:MAG: cobalamin biosynthesis protein [Nitrospinota bacterium]|nr:cobalamin biosynthesis protein [Nitrospinota bacterium]